jgi:hypothetical protein
MSHAKFASVTGSLLARKGEAVPWHGPLNPRVVTVAAPETSPRPLRPSPPPHARHDVPPPPVANGTFGDKMHKYAVHMSERDYEKLGLLAVKHGSTRQQLMQRALAEFLAAQAREYGGACPCLGACDMGCEGAVG